MSEVAPPTSRRLRRPSSAAGTVAPRISGPATPQSRSASHSRSHARSSVSSGALGCSSQSDRSTEAHHDAWWGSGSSPSFTLNTSAPSMRLGGGTGSPLNAALPTLNEDVGRLSESLALDVGRLSSPALIWQRWKSLRDGSAGVNGRLGSASDARASEIESADVGRLRVSPTLGCRKSLRDGSAGVNGRLGSASEARASEIAW